MQTCTHTAIWSISGKGRHVATPTHITPGWETLQMNGFLYKHVGMHLKLYLSNQNSVILFVYTIDDYTSYIMLI